MANEIYGNTEYVRAYNEKHEEANDAADILGENNLREWAGVAFFYSSRNKIISELLQNKIVDGLEAEKLKHEDIIQLIQMQFYNMLEPFLLLFRMANYSRYKLKFKIQENRYIQLRIAHEKILKFDKTQASY